MSIGLIPPPTVNYGSVYLGKYTGSGVASIDIVTRNAPGCPGYGGAIFSTDYDVYEIVVDGLTVSNSGVNILLRVSTDGGISYDSSALYNHSQYGYGPAGPGSCNGASQTSLALNCFANTSNAANNSFNMSWTLFHPLSASLYKMFGGTTHFWDTGPNLVVTMASGSYKSTSAVNAFQIFPSAGTETGAVYVYGKYKG